MSCKVTKKDLIDLGVRIFEKAGLSPKNAKLAALILATNDERGVYSHGSSYYYSYACLLREGGAAADAKMTVDGNGAFRQLNGGDGLGILVAHRAMEEAISTAKEYGIGIVTVRNSSHCAATGYYASMAAQTGMIGIAMSNGVPIMSIPGAKGRVLGNNPFAYAAPLDGDRIVLFDVAMSVIAGSKIPDLVRSGKKIPEGWMLDKDGNQTTDPQAYHAGGTLLPFAMHKGYGFAVMVEILASVLSGACIVKDNIDWPYHYDTPSKAGHCMIAIDPGKVYTPDEFRKRMQKMERDIKSAETVGDAVILLPGEMEYEKTQKQKDGIILNESICSNLDRAAEEWGLTEVWESIKMI